MSITRIGESQAKSDTLEALRDLLLSMILLIKSSQGCESGTLYQSHEDPAKFTMIEVWDSIESHQASVRNIPSEMLAQIRPFLAPTPGEGILYTSGSGDIIRLSVLIRSEANVEQPVSHTRIQGTNPLIVSRQHFAGVHSRGLPSVFVLTRTG